MLPIVGNRTIALVRQAALLQRAPIVVGPPDRAEREARLEGDRTRHEIAAEGDADHADPARIHVGSRLEIIDDFRGPTLGVEHGRHAVASQRLAGAGLIDVQG